MNKNEALAVMEANIFSGRIAAGRLGTRQDIEMQLRLAATGEPGLRNAIFELGVSELAKAFKKSDKGRR